MDCKWFDVPQPSMLNVSIAQANAAKIVLRFTAEYLPKEIFRIVAASVTCDKVTKVTTLTRTWTISRLHDKGRGPIAQVRQPCH
jgi:hypothetical protein